MKLEFPRQIFEESSYIKFQENPSSGNLVFLWGRMDGRTDGREEAVFVCSSMKSSGGLLWMHKADVFCSKGKTKITCKELFDLVTDRNKKKTG